MGEPVDGTLFYGYCWREEIVFDDEHDVSKSSALVRESFQQCEVGWYGVDGHEATFVYVTDTATTAGQFNPEPVNLVKAVGDHISNHRWRDAMLEIFLKEYGVEPPSGDNQPGWWRVSRYVS